MMERDALRSDAFVIGLSTAFDYRGTTVLVTGASSGIGAAFAQSLAERGANLVLVARSIDVLNEMAARLRSEFSVTVETMRIDLADRADRERLIEAYATREIDVLINNAGLGSHGTLTEVPAAEVLHLVDLNCAAVVDLTRTFLPRMLQQDSGGVINVASTAAFQPTPQMATYGATKAFVLSFSQALSTECRRSRVNVLAFCPGAVATNFSSALGEPRLTDRVFSRAPGAAYVVPGALDAFAHSKSLYIPGMSNRLGAISVRFAPRRLTALVTNKLLSS
jgi:short-subunit dehydrogenase